MLYVAVKTQQIISDIDTPVVSTQPLAVYWPIAGSQPHKRYMPADDILCNPKYIPALIEDWQRGVVIGWRFYPPPRRW